MNRQKTLLSILGAVLLVVLAFMFLLRPQMTEADEVRVEIEDTKAQQQQVQAQIAQLEDVRSRSPEIEALVTAADTVIPHDDPALPAAVRQFQMAANESGASLVSVSTARPEVAESVTETPFPDGLAAINTTMTVSGGYFQLVDFLRRIEDPVLSPRAVLWSQANVSLDEYPTLTLNLSGSMFAYLDDIGATPEGGSATPTDDGTETEGEATETETVTETETEVPQ